ncbi:ATP-grasp domain-containing protein [Streptomyces sp. SP18CS02]|uniref:ATP-grasp domain-containing protein n=1 Tax=Streptomyces sp. SP18CS02 TaxID=3002531 RepID=UPI002E79A265|nr:ATP-grasp domain-containing protein [Streptomyces sp. SP18CS02]MEE1752736.1 ATP-grasp domain-containing protein [Streptomyces sp. SP18CS02]
MVIVVCGIASEPPVALVTEALRHQGLPYTMLHQRRFMDSSLDIRVEGTTVLGRLRCDGRTVPCSSVTGIYTRLMDWRLLPGMRDAGPETLRRCQAWHETLDNWIEIAPGCVMNRSSATATNGSKPYQAQLIRQAGFRVPETLATDDPDLALAFRARHGRVIYKSISSVRSIVHLLDDEAVDRLPLIRSCPVQFQRYIPGVDVRVHVVAGEPFATRVDSDQVDYRYAGRYGGRVELTPWDLPENLARRCTDLATRLGLALAGIDLLLADDGEVYCFEVNPSPAFNFYEDHTGQPISQAIAHALGRGLTAPARPPIP